MNTVRRRVLLLLSILAAGFLAAQLLWRAHEVQEATLALYKSVHKRAALVHEVLQLKGEGLVKEVEAYSGRRDLVGIIRKPEQRLGEANPATELAADSVSDVWVFDRKGREIYAFGRLGGNRALDLPLPASVIAKLFAGADTRHFFINTRLGLMEIAGAEIPMTPGIQRTAGRSGYLLAGKLWNRSYLNELSKLTDSHLAVITGYAIGRVQPARPGGIGFSENLLGWDGNRVARLRIVSSSPARRTLFQSHWQAILLSPLLALVLLGVVWSILWRLVSQPLRSIATFVDTQDPKVIEFLEGKRTELGNLARMVRVSVEQKAALELEIMRRKETELALRRSEEQYRRIVETAGEGIFVTDSETKITVANGRLGDLLGYRREELVGISALELIHPECLGIVKSQIARRKKGSRDQYDVRLCRKDGTELWAILSASPASGPAGEYAGSLVMITDITDRRLMELALRNSERKLRLIAENTPDVVFAFDMRRHSLYVNPAFQKLTGYPVDELTQGRIVKWVHPEDAPLVTQAADRVYGGELSSDAEFRVITTDGQEKWCSGSWGPLFDDAGVQIGIQGRLHDITERKHVEEELLKMSLVARKTASAVLIMDADGRIEWANDAFTRILGYTLEEVHGRGHESVLSGINPNEAPATGPVRGRLAAVPVRQEIMNSTKDGRVIWLDVEFTPIIGDSGEVVRFVGIGTDITARKEAEEALTRSERQFRAVFDLAVDGMVLINDDGHYVDVNPAACVLCGMSRDELLKCSVADFLDRGSAFNVVWEEFSQLGTHRHESLMVRPDGQRRLLEISASWDVLPGLHLAVLRDITEQKRAAEEAGRLVTAMEQVDEAIVITNLRGIVQYVNPAFERFTGFSRSEAIGHIPLILRKKWHTPDAYRALWQRLRTGEPWRGQLRHERKDGAFLDEQATICPVRDAGGHIVNYVYVFRDVTQQLALQAQLHQAQKLEAVGQLAAGIAHEINTPTQYVGDNTRFLQDSFGSVLTALDKYNELVERAEAEKRWPELLAELERVKGDLDLAYLSEEIPKAIEQSLEGVDRVTKLVRAMKEFSHPGTREKTLLDINKAIETTATVARNEWKYVAELETDFDPNLPLVPCLPGDMNQVLLNVIVNAAHAIGEACGERPEDKGIISVSTRLDGDWVEIRIRDSGPGMPDAIRARVFDPFFTTKQVGKGTGQGLAISRSIIVEKHNGTIECETETGKGTTFIIRLPLSLGEVGAAVGLKAA